MTQSTRFAPTCQCVEVTECLDVGAVLRHGKSQCVRVTINIDAMEGLIMSGGVTLAPKARAGARVVHPAAGLEGGNDGFLVVIATIVCCVLVL